MEKNAVAVSYKQIYVGVVILVITLSFLVQDAVTVTFFSISLFCFVFDIFRVSAHRSDFFFKVS